MRLQNMQQVLICPRCLQDYPLEKGDKPEKYTLVTCEYCNQDFNGLENCKRMKETSLEKLRDKAYELAKKLYPERFK